MKRSTKFALAAVAALGLGIVAVPVIAQQAQGQHGMMDGQQGGMQGHGKQGGGMQGGGMGGARNYAMTTFDTDKDGTLSAAEITAGIQSELKTYDADANGTLSLDEFALMHAAHIRPDTVRVFQMQDADGDAQVTEAELSAAMTMMQEHMGAKDGGGMRGHGKQGGGKQGGGQHGDHQGQMQGGMQGKGQMQDN